MPDSAPHTTQLDADHEAVATAATRVDPVGRVPYAGTVSGVTFTPNADLTGANTNTRLLEIINKGLDGNGTTVVASLQFNAGTSALDFDETTVTLSGTPANLVVAEGAVLSLRSAAVGTGLADPGGTVRVEITRS